MLVPAHEEFKKLGQKCIENRTAIDLFIAQPPKKDSLDLATIAPLCGLSGGDLHFFPNFDLTEHAEKIYFAVFRAMTKVTGSDVRIKMRVSSGYTVTNYIGGFERE